MPFICGVDYFLVFEQYNSKTWMYWHFCSHCVGCSKWWWSSTCLDINQHKFMLLSCTALVYLVCY